MVVRKKSHKLTKRKTSRKSTTRKFSKKQTKTLQKPKFSMLIKQSQRNSADFKIFVLRNDKVAGELKNIRSSQVVGKAVKILNYAKRKKINLVKAWDAVA